LCPLRLFNAPSGCRFDVLSLTLISIATLCCDAGVEAYRTLPSTFLFRMILPSGFMVAVDYCTAVSSALNNLRLSDIKLYESYLKRLQKVIDGLGIDMRN